MLEVLVALIEAEKFYYAAPYLLSSPGRYFDLLFLLVGRSDLRLLLAGHG